MDTSAPLRFPPPPALSALPTSSQHTCVRHQSVTPLHAFIPASLTTSRPPLSTDQERHCPNNLTWASPAVILRPFPVQVRLLLPPPPRRRQHALVRHLRPSFPEGRRHVPALRPRKREGRDEEKVGVSPAAHTFHTTPHRLRQASSVPRPTITLHPLTLPTIGSAEAACMTGGVLVPPDPTLSETLTPPRLAVASSTHASHALESTRPDQLLPSLPTTLLLPAGLTSSVLIEDVSGLSSSLAPLNCLESAPALLPPAAASSAVPFPSGLPRRAYNQEGDETRENEHIIHASVW